MDRQLLQAPAQAPMAGASLAPAPAAGNPQDITDLTINTCFPSDARGVRNLSYVPLYSSTPEIGNTSVKVIVEAAAHSHTSAEQHAFAIRALHSYQQPRSCPASCTDCHSWKESGTACPSLKLSGAAGPQKAADGVFVFDAASVTFVNASSLILSGLPNSTAYVQYPPRVNAGTFAKVYPC